MRMIRTFAIMAAIAMAALPLWALETNPKREHRSAWVTPITGDWPTSSYAQGTTATAASYSKGEIDKIIANAKAYGLNTLYVHVRPYADRVYNKNSWKAPDGTTYTVYEPFGHWTTKTRGVENSNYDPLEYWVEKAHAAGIELYAWINPYRISIVSGNTTANSKIGKIYGSVASTTQDEALLTNGWCIRYYNSSDNRTYTVFNPCLEQSKSRITTVCRVLTGNYDIDGIIMDDYFYVPGGYPEDESAVDYNTWKASGSKLSIADWRREHVNDMVARCYEAVHEVKPWVRFSIGPAGVATEGLKVEDGIPPLSNYCSAGDWQYNQIYADPLAWMREQTVDFLSPQLYWRTTHSSNPFGPLTEWWSIAAQKFERPVWPSGYASSYLGSSDSEENWRELDTEIQLTRQHTLDNSPGYVHYSSRWIVGPTSTNAGDYIARHSCQHQAVTPAMTWFDAPDPGRIKNLVKGEAKLTFDAMSNMRYIAYAVPQSVSPRDAMSEQGGFKAEYIIGVSYTNSIDIPAGMRKQAEYWHAVAPLDRFGNEWPATTVNAPIVGDCEVSLVSPHDGVTAQGKQTFSWTGTPGADFTLELSTYPDFYTVNLSREVNATSTVVDFTNWAPGLRMYWRVRANMSMMNEAVSEVRSFTIPGETNLPLHAPEGGATATADISFVCKEVGAATYTLQVSRQSGFGTLVFEGSDNWQVESLNGVNWRQRTLPITLFTDGAYFWRVLGKSLDGTVVATSEVRSLHVSHGVAAVDGYEPWHEPYEFYPSTKVNSNTTLLTNLWARNASHNPTGINGAMSRDMVARPADADQETDIVYVAARSASSTEADTWLYRFDAVTGASLPNLHLTYDKAYSNGYPNNGVVLDDANNLIVHNMNLSSTGSVNIGMVNPATGIVTQKVLVPATVRVDHIDVWGDVTSNDYYVFGASSAGNKVIRWHVKNSAVSETKTYDLTSGIAPRVHAVSANRAWIDGSAINPKLFDFSTGAVVSNGTLSGSSINTSSNGVSTFKHNNKAFIVYNNQYAGSSNSAQWTIATLNDYTASVAGHSAQWVVPSSFNLGTIGGTDFDGGDLGGPVSVIQHGNALTKSSGSENTTHIFMMSPANGLTAYALTTHVVTGVDDISVESTADTDCGTAPVYYNLQGMRVINPANGIYIERRGNSSRKVRR